MTPQPPRLAAAFLRLCCSPAYLEDIEGDLHELFLRRVERSGHARARRRYVLDVAGVCVRQLAVRAAAAPRRHTRVHVSPLGLVCLSLASVVLLFSLHERWSTAAGYGILCVLGAIEVATYVAALGGVVKAWRRQSPRDQRQK